MTVKKTAADEWLWHEAMDRAACLEAMFQTLLADHPVMAVDSEVAKALERAGEALGDLYQKISARRFSLPSSK